MHEPDPTAASTPPPFDWSRYQPPAATTTFGGSPPPPSPPSPQGGGDRRRHPAHRARVAAAVVSGMAFAGLLGVTAFSRTSDAAATQPTDDDTASAGVPRDTDDGQLVDPYGDDGYGESDEYGGDDGYDSYSERPAPPGWGGSAQSGGGLTTPDSGTGSGESSGPTLRSQGS